VITNEGDVQAQQALNLGVETQRKLESFPLLEYFVGLQRILEELRRVDTSFFISDQRELVLSTLRALEAAAAGEENQDEAFALRKQWESHAVTAGEEMERTARICHFIAIELSVPEPLRRYAAEMVMTNVVGEGLPVTLRARDIVDQIERKLYNVDEWRP
jgi:hypothetical protein